MKKVLILFGTRPEVIKLSPVIRELKGTNNLQSVICSAAQQRELSDIAIKDFDISIDYDLDLMQQNQTLAEFGSTALKGIDKVIKTEAPDIVLCHGDTSTALFSALAAFYNQIPIGHIEAGLRTGSIAAPFPEEANRRLISKLSDLHFSPTKEARQNLISEGVPKDSILITGNTVIDALQHSLKKLKQDSSLSSWSSIKDSLLIKNKVILVTGHRRENFGKSFEEIFNALVIIASEIPVEIVYPVHLNPNVRDHALRILKSSPNIHLIEPLDYFSFLDAMKDSFLIISDSGGIQEEAPSLGKPVLVLRDQTERPEGIIAGTSILVGSSMNKIIYEAVDLYKNNKRYSRIANISNPYGDGQASKKIVHKLIGYLKHD